MYSPLGYQVGIFTIEYQDELTYQHKKEVSEPKWYGLYHKNALIKWVFIEVCEYKK